MPNTHTSIKKLTQNKKSWFNQDIFKEINASIDEHYNNISNKDIKTQMLIEEQNLENNDSDYETDSEGSELAFEKMQNKEIKTKLKRNQNVKDNITYKAEDKESDEMSDDEMVIQHTKDQNSGKLIRQRKLKEKREKADAVKPKDDKIQVVAQNDFSELHSKFQVNDDESDDTDAEEDTVVQRLAIAKKILRKKDKHSFIDDSYNR